MQASQQIQIDFLRHGELASHTKAYIGQTDIPVSNQGYQAMQDLIHTPYDLIISSPLSRCKNFSNDLSHKTDTALIIEPNFQELHFGDFEAQTYDMLMSNGFSESLLFWWSDMEKNSPPNGETLASFRERVISSFESLILKTAKIETKQSNILCVTHAGVIRCLACFLLGMNDKRFFDIEINRASLSRFIINPENLLQSRVLFLNKTA